MDIWSAWWQWFTLSNAIVTYTAYNPLWWCDFGKILNHSQQEYDADLWRRYMEKIK